MAVMKAKQFVDMCIAIANSPTVYYSVSGGAWCKWNGSKWNMDCVCMIKGILWGFNFNKLAAHGGAVYASNGVYDDNADQIMKRCTKVSTDFKNIKVGEILHMGGHVGVYIGNRQVVESTAAWNYCTQISTVDENGARHKGNNYCGYWQQHGELSYIDYEEEKSMKHKVSEVVEINGVYVSSMSTEKLTPKITKGTITKIVEGARNPYLLDNGNIGWVNDDCIVEPKPTDYKILYEEEVKKNKDLEEINKQLKEKIDKAIKDLS